MRMVLIIGEPGDGQSTRIRRGPAYKARLGHKRMMVYASRSPQGLLAVAICTRDLGHAGEYGFGYLEADDLDVPGGMFMYEPESKVEDHWYRVLNNLH